MATRPFLYVPNLIGKFPFRKLPIMRAVGYFRVLLMIVSFYAMPKFPALTIALYSVSCNLDAIDGYLARRLGQATKFGAVLDMITDRFSTCGLLVFLATIYSKIALLFQLLVALDICSHFMIMYRYLLVILLCSSLCCGSSSHKQVRKSAPWLLQLYYTSRPVLYFVCAGTEVCYLMLYLLHYVHPNFVLVTIFLVSAPVCLLKQVINLVQLVESAMALEKLDKAK